MAKKEEAKPAAAATNKGGACLAEGCTKGIERAEFCAQHFNWFKLGLITKSGSRAKDFDKKYMQHVQRSEASI